MKFIALILATTLSTGADDISLSSVNTTITKSPDNSWLLSYRVNEPVYRLGFVRNPDNSRTTRWVPADAEFEVVLDSNKEYVQKTDGSKFSQVNIHLTPTYTHLSKDYAPFSPFSDGGLLIHTGRLFACANECHEGVNYWKMTVDVPPGEHIIIHGDVLTQTHSWLGSKDGTKVYVGKQTPVETSNVIAVIDKGLPEEITLSLDFDIPRMMNFFEAKLGKKTGTKPTLFASYANVSDHSSQGGTLPHQIFMHWNRNDLDDSVSDKDFLNDTLWFFAHEVAHLYQENDGLPLFGEGSESWVHEGNAEWLALKMLTALYPDKKDYVDNRVSSYKKKCTAALNAYSLSKAAGNGNFTPYYTCGLLIHRAIDEALTREQSKDIYSLWNRYRDEVNGGEKKGAETFLNITQKWTSPVLVNKIEQVLHLHLQDPESALGGLEAVQSD